MAFIVRNPSAFSYELSDDFLQLTISSGESIDLEGIYRHDQLYYSSQPPVGALWLAITSGGLVRRDDADLTNVPIGNAFYDAVWRYSPDQGQKEALVGTVPIPSASNRYVTELDFGVPSYVQTTDNALTLLYQVEIPENSVALCQTWIVAARTSGAFGAVGDCGSFIRIGTVRNIANSVSLMQIESAYTYRNQKHWNVEWGTLGSKLLIQVKGSLDNTINWQGKTRLQIEKF